MTTLAIAIVIFIIAISILCILHAVNLSNLLKFMHKNDYNTWVEIGSPTNFIFGVPDGISNKDLWDIDRKCDTITKIKKARNLTNNNKSKEAIKRFLFFNKIINYIIIICVCAIGISIMVEIINNHLQANH
jgi:hypothetical protein